LPGKRRLCFVGAPTHSKNQGAYAAPLAKCIKKQRR
jgi:hypothetical protein